MMKTLVLVAIASFLGGSGHVLLAKGMKTIGDMTEAPSHRLVGMAVRVVSNPWVLLGVALQATFFGMYLALLSRAEVSQVLPMTAMDYIVVVVLAQVVLAEAVTPIRWLGVALISAGVLMVWRN
jgi:drug/metabolite transporter (DMT)-like permease